MVNKHKVLITGSTGLLAYEFINEYRNHYDIFAVTHSSRAHRVSGVEYIDIDFSKDWNVNILPSEVDFVIHLSQSPKFRDFPDSAIEVFNVNLLSTMKLLDYSRTAKVRKFVFASTGGIYGSSPSPISTNSEILSPTGLSHYFGSKLSAEIFANNYRDFFAVDINRIFFMYGPRQSKNMLIPRLITSVAEGNAIQLAGPNGISINPVFVSDVANFLHFQLTNCDSQVFNVAGSEIMSIKDLVKIIQNHFGGNPNFDMLPEAPNIVADATDFLSKLNADPVTFEQGIKRFSKSN
jgi:UDP-glucose 4-epimerase